MSDDLGRTDVVASATIPFSAHRMHMIRPQKTCKGCLWVHELDAAVMMVDISGFSSMCERFAEGEVSDEDSKRKKQVQHIREKCACAISRGWLDTNEYETRRFGAERVRDALDNALKALISTVEHHGGDVLRIVGDALIVLFHKGGVRISPEDFAELCLDCSRCGLDCAMSKGVGTGKIRNRGGQGGSGSFGTVFDNSKGLKVHVGIGCGRVRCFHVGSDLRGWQLVVSGEVFGSQVANALAASNPGEVVVSAEVWHHLAGLGFHASPVQDDRGTSPPGLHLLQWIPNIWDSARMANLDEEIIENGADVGHDSVLEGDGKKAAASAAPFHDGAGALLNSSHAQDAACRRVFIDQAGAGAVVTFAHGPPDISSQGIAASLGSVGASQLGARWCPLRRRLSLLEEVETGVLTMLSKDVRRALKSYCPQPITEELVAERNGLLCEIQRVAVLFVGLSFEGIGLNRDAGLLKPANQNRDSRREGESKAQSREEEIVAATSIKQLNVLQASFTRMQSIVSKQNGFIKELSVDDKGTVLVAGFGLSGHGGHLPAARATLCAMECTTKLRSKGLPRCHAGVATGPVFCGSLGSANRREFTMVSETVNLAQRIMSVRMKTNLRSTIQAALIQKAKENNEKNENRKTAKAGHAKEAPPAISTQPMGEPTVFTPLSNSKQPASEGGRKSLRSWKPKIIASGPAVSKGSEELAFKSAPTAVPPGLLPHYHQSTKRESSAISPSFTPLGIPINLSTAMAGAMGTVMEAEAAPSVPVVDKTWEEKGFNQWVVLESDTYEEAKKTPMLAFLELEAVEVRGKRSKVSLFAPGLSTDAEEAIRGANDPSLPQGAVFGGSGSSFSRKSTGVSDVSTNGQNGEHVAPGTPPMSRNKSLEEANRYVLESPVKVDIFAPEGSFQKRGNTAVLSSGESSDQVSPFVSAGLDPSPDKASKEMDEWNGKFSGPGKNKKMPGCEGEGEGQDAGEDVLSRETFETLLPWIFHADKVHDDVSHILWARSRGRVSYLSDVCQSLLGLSKDETYACVSAGDVGKDGMWRLKLNEFAHMLKLASRVPSGVEGELKERLSELPYTAGQVVLRIVCVTVVAGLGEIDLLLHLLENVVHFKEYWEVEISRRAASTSPTPSKRKPLANCTTNPCDAEEGNVGDLLGGNTTIGATRRRAESEVLEPVSGVPIAGRSRSGTEGSTGSLGMSSRHSGDTSAEGAGLRVLLSCLKRLQQAGFLSVCEDQKTFLCKDVMLIDQVYTSTPFKLRKALHKEAAKWIAARHRESFLDRAEVMPVLISHLTQAHEEGRAQAMLLVLKVLGGRFLDRWVLKHVGRMVAIRESDNPRAMEHLALCVLPALPSLRGLSKAIRGAEIAGVVVTVALRLRSLRFKNMDKMAGPIYRRSVSSLGAARTSTRRGKPSRAYSARASIVGIKLRARSLTGGATAPSPYDLKATL